MNIVSNDSLTSMLNHVAAGKEKMTCVTVAHKNHTLLFKIDDKIQLSVEVNVKSGLKSGSSFELVLADLSIVAAEGELPLPSTAVKQSASSRGCSKQDAEFLKAFSC